MPFFKQAVRKEHLIARADGNMPIETITAWSLSKKLDYAWKVYNSDKVKYKAIHKKGAVEFLRKSFGLPMNPDNAILLQQIIALMTLKTSMPDRIPTVLDLPPHLAPIVKVSSEPAIAETSSSIGPRLHPSVEADVHPELPIRGEAPSVGARVDGPVISSSPASSVEEAVAASGEIPPPVPPTPLIRKPKAILIVVSDGCGGYGDFLFALKLSEQLRKQYADAGSEIPPVYLVTQPTGEEKIKTLKGDTEFGVEVLTPDELKVRVDAKQIDVGTVIEAPVFKSELISRIDAALTNAGSHIPLVMIPEYGYSSDGDRRSMRLDENRRRKYYEHLSYTTTLYSGFNKDAAETGILLSEALVHPAAPDVLASQLDEKIRSTTFGDLDVAGYRTTTELSMQYSHDIYDWLSSLETPAARFLKIHREFAKTSDKNQEVLAVGKDEKYKREALLAIKDQLIADGYKRISFFNADSKAEEVLYDAGVAGKSYRVIYTSGMSHPSMIAANALSGPLYGATGDQSLGEALSSNKMMVYECLWHKVTLIENYDAAMREISHDDPDVKDTLALLRSATTDIEYQQLGDRLRNPVIQEKLQRFNKVLLRKYDFVSQIVQADERWELEQRTKIASVLHDGNHTEAARILLKFQNRISVTDTVGGKTLLQHAIDNNPTGYFVKLPLLIEITRLLKAGEQQLALDMMLANESLIASGDEFEGKPLFKYAMDNNPEGIFTRYHQRFKSGTVTAVDAEETTAGEERRVADALPIVEEPAEIVAAREILEGKTPATEPGILRTETGFYKLNPIPIGRGGWGSVYAAQHYSLDKGNVIVSAPLAIKQMNGYRVTAILDKEHLLFKKVHGDKVFERFTKGRSEYLAMPLFAGTALDTYLTSHELSLKERQLMALELLTDLSHIHASGVIHHDIKPKNTLFDPVTKKMHILDFGCAEEMGSPIKYQNIDTAKYAIEYMPPEYITGVNTSTANDIYSMTLSLAEILGINKRELVQARLEQALKSIDDEDFKRTMRTSFAEHETLDETMFSAEIGAYIDTPVFESFLRNYTAGQYDFSPYQEQLGDTTIALLNAMQARDPADRPTAKACLEQLQEGIPVVGAETAEMRSRIKELRGGPEDHDDALSATLR